MAANTDIYPFGQGANIPSGYPISNSLNVLFIGNSFSLDAVSYSLKILKNLVPAIKVTIGVLYQASSKLAHHVDKLNSSSNTSGISGHLYENGYIGDTDDAAWVTTSNQNPDTMISSKQWDVVVLHQRSQESGDYRTFDPYFDNIVSYVKSKLPNVKIGWLITQAYSNTYVASNPKVNSQGTTYSTSAAMYDAITSASKHIVAYRGLDFVIPVGTAIQILRSTSYGEPTADGYHLNTGIPVLTAGYCMSMTILDKLGIDTSVMGCTYEPAIGDDLQANGTFDSTLITPANILLAKKCAMLANAEKYNTQIVF